MSNDFQRNTTCSALTRPRGETSCVFNDHICLPGSVYTTHGGVIRWWICVIRICFCCLQLLLSKIASRVGACLARGYVARICFHEIKLHFFKFDIHLFPIIKSLFTNWLYIRDESKLSNRCTRILHDSLSCQCALSCRWSVCSWFASRKYSLICFFLEFRWVLFQILWNWSLKNLSDFVLTLHALLEVKQFCKNSYVLVSFTNMSQGLSAITVPPTMSWWWSFLFSWITILFPVLLSHVHCYPHWCKHCNALTN